MRTKNSYTIIPNFLSLTLKRNFGAAFGIFQGQKWLLIIISFIVIFLIIYYYKRFDCKLGLTLLLAGTIGNLIDRIYFGYVTDLISIWFWSIFNLADIYNTLGAALIIIYLFKTKNGEF